MKLRSGFQCTHFQVKNGKLVPRPSTPEKKVNYKYIPFTPLNKPTTEDYYKSTINELLSELETVKSSIKNISREKGQTNIGSQESLKRQMAELKHKNDLLQAELSQQKALNDMKNYQLHNSYKQNTILQQRNHELKAELDRLSMKIERSEQEVERIDNVLDRCGYELLSRLDHFQKLVTDGFSSQIQHDNHEEEEFYSIGNKSIPEARQYEQQQLDYRYYTPKVKTFEFGEEQFEQKPSYTPNVNNANGSVTKIKNTADTKSENKSSESDLSENLMNWAELSGNRNFSTLQILNNEDQYRGSLQDLCFR